MGQGISRSTMLYFHEISRIVPVSDPAEERRLIHRWQTRKDTKARDALVQGHLRFVVTLARRRSRDPDRLQDLVAAGNIGLLKALDKFDLARKPPIRFLTYAGWWVTKEIADEDYATSSLVHVPTHRQKAQRKQAKVFQKTLQTHGPEARAVLEMDPGIPEASTMTLDHFKETADVWNTRPPGNLAASDLALRRAISQLPVREQTVLNLYFGVKDDPRNFAQIAAILGMCPERVRQIKISGVKQLRSVLEDQSVLSPADAY